MLEESTQPDYANEQMSRPVAASPLESEIFHRLKASRKHPTAPPMSAVNKFMGVLASAFNGLTVSAVNFNLDFSLVKVEAPQEYLALGQSLSEKRGMRERGSAHFISNEFGTSKGRSHEDNTTTHALDKIVYGL
jgi:hypothetical protein